MSAAPGPTLDQRRARHAWDAVARIRNDSKARPSASSYAREAKRTAMTGMPRDPARPSASSYAREAKRLPVRILTAGLGHALAFLDAKAGRDESANTALLRDVADWVLNKREKTGSSAERPKSNALIEKIVTSDAAFLQIATDEVLAYLQWLTRFAEAEFGANDD